MLGKFLTAEIAEDDAVINSSICMFLSANVPLMGPSSVFSSLSIMLQSNCGWNDSSDTSGQRAPQTAISQC